MAFAASTTAIAPSSPTLFPSKLRASAARDGQWLQQWLGTMQCGKAAGDGTMVLTSGNRFDAMAQRAVRYFRLVSDEAPHCSAAASFSAPATPRWLPSRLSDSTRYCSMASPSACMCTGRSILWERVTIDGKRDGKRDLALEGATSLHLMASLAASLNTFTTSVTQTAGMSGQ